jgi:hypothetical protein
MTRRSAAFNEENNETPNSPTTVHKSVNNQPVTNNIPANCPGKLSSEWLCLAKNLSYFALMIRTSLLGFSTNC